MQSRWYARPGGTRELCERDNPIGGVFSGNVFPYITRRVQLEVRPLEGESGTEWREWVVPASPEEAAISLSRMGWYDAQREDERRLQEAERAALELWQESWFCGVPATEAILCAACQKERPAHGSNLYDATLLCNRCVRQVELLMAKGELRSLDAWAQEVATRSHLEHVLDEAEMRGYCACFPLPDGRWLELYPLYQYTRNPRGGRERHVR